jgi:hypothetical protein
MAEIPQHDWRKLAAQEFVGFRVLGNGPWAVLFEPTLTVQLFEYELLARATGKHVLQIKPPAPRPAFRRIKYGDDE